MTQYKLACVVLFCAICWPAMVQSNPKVPLKDIKPLLCPSEKAPKKILGVYQGRFSTVDRQDVVVLHSACKSADKSTKAHVSWFYFKDKTPVRLSRSNLYRQIIQCIESKHHDKTHVYCLTRTKSSDKISLEAIKFYSSYRTGLTGLLYAPRKTKCTRENIINDEPKSLKANGSVIEVESVAKSCVKAGKKFKMNTVKISHRVELTSGNYVSSHRAKNAKTNLLLDTNDNSVMSQSSYRRPRYRRYPTSQPRSRRKTNNKVILGMIGTTGSTVRYGGLGLSGTGRGSGGISSTGIGIGQIGTKGYGRGSIQRQRTIASKTMAVYLNKKKDNGVAKAVVRRRKHAFEYCLEREFRKTPAKKKLALKMTIEGQGNNQLLSNVTAKDKTKNKVIPAPALRCVEKMAKRLRFPKETFGKKTPFEVRLSFTHTPTTAKNTAKKAATKKKKSKGQKTESHQRGLLEIQ